MRKIPHTGEVFVDVQEVGSVRLRFDWRAIAALRGEYGEEWEPTVSEHLSAPNTTEIAKILAICSNRGEDWWLERSPPLIPTAHAVQRALHLAFFGPGGAAENPHLARRLMTLLQRAGGYGSSSAGGPRTSGA